MILMFCFHASTLLINQQDFCNLQFFFFTLSITHLCGKGLIIQGLKCCLSFSFISLKSESDCILCYCLFIRLCIYFVYLHSILTHFPPGDTYESSVTIKDVRISFLQSHILLWNFFNVFCHLMNYTFFY